MNGKFMSYLNSLAYRGLITSAFIFVILYVSTGECFEHAVINLLVIIAHRVTANEFVLIPNPRKQ